MKNFKWTKKTLIIFIVGMFLFSILSIFITFHKTESYTKNLTNEDQRKTVEETLNCITDDELKKEIEENIDAKIFYNELKEIPNYQYKKHITKYLKKADEILKNNGNSLVEYYNSGVSLSNILFTTCGDEYIDYSNAYLVGDDENKEYLKSNSESLYFKLLDDLSQGNYDGILSQLETILDTYKFTEEYNYKIANIYHDILILKNNIDIGNTSSSDILSELYDPCVYTIETMKLFIDDRYNIIEDKNSPYLFDSAIITIKDIEIKEISINSEEYKDNLYKMIFNRYSIAKDDPLYSVIVNKILFTDNVNKEEFYAYVIKNNDKSCAFYTIKPSDKTKTYETISEHKSVYDNANQQLQEVAR